MIRRGTWLLTEHVTRFYKFPHYIETTTFGISCDAYTNLKETLTRHKTMVAEYLDKNYDRVGIDRPRARD